MSKENKNQVSSEKIKIQYEQGTRAYSGSLTQITFAENDIKGFLLWDTTTKESTFVHVPNKYDYVTVKFESLSEIDNYFLNNEHNPYTQFRIIVLNDITKADKETIGTRFIDHYKLRDKPKIESNVQNIVLANKENKDLWLDYSQFEKQITILQTWLHDNKYGQDYVEHCSNIHKDLIANINVPHYNNVSWKIKRLEWDNIGRYGEDNYINFENIHGITGLFGLNRIGKSSIINTIPFALYGKGIKKANNSKIINVLKNKARTEIIIDLDGVDYKIERHFSRTKNNANVSSILRIQKNIDGNWEDFNADDSNKTRDVITEMFGDRNDLLMTAISGQEKSSLLIDSGETDRLKTLYHLANLHFFEDLQSCAKEEIKIIEQEIKILQKTNNVDLYHLMVSKIDVQENKISEIESLLENLKSKLHVLSDNIKQLENGKRTIDNTINVLDLKAEHKKLSQTIKTINQNIDSSNHNKEIDASTIVKLKNDVRTQIHDKKIEEVLGMLVRVKNLEDEKQKININRRVIDQQSKDIERKVHILTIQTWHEDDPNCKKCMFLQDAWKAKEESNDILQKLSEYNIQIDAISNELAEIGFSSQEINNLQTSVNRVKLAKANVDKYDAQIKSYLTELEISNGRIAEIEKLLQAHIETFKLITENETIQHNLEELDLEYRKIEREITNSDKQLWTYKSDLASLTGHKYNMEVQLKNILDLEQKIKYYRVYADAVSKNGVPFEIIQHILPKINNEVNQILSQTQDWKINISTDKDNLNINIVQNLGNTECEWSIDCASGAERIMSSIALRVAFTRLSFLPRPSFLIIDEGFSSLDSANVILIQEFLDNMKKYFEFILLVSHETHIQDSVDQHIEIQHDGDFSKVNYE